MPARRLVAVALLGLMATLGSWTPAGAAEPEPEEPDATVLEVYDPLFEEDGDEEALDRDPLEGANRWTFAFNQGLDRWLLDPLTHGYQWLVPGPARRGVNRVSEY